MHLIYRPARLDDLPACLACTRDIFAFDGCERQQLLKLWRELLAGGAINFWVMENLEGAPGEAIAYFCLVAFVTDEFASQLKTTLPPYVALQALKGWAAGDSPFLDLPAVRCANSRGSLNMVCLQSGFQADMVQRKSEPGREVRDKIPDMICLTGQGYGVQECFFDAYGDWERQWAVMTGFHVRNDHAGFYAAQPDGVLPEQRAFLCSITRAEALRQEGSPIAPVFHGRAPRFSFTGGEQEMLLWALTGLTDEELAQELRLAEITVSKRWARIYERVQDAAPEMFPPKAPVGGPKRGPEKRRRLLHYLRHHLEELRPVVLPRRSP